MMEYIIGIFYILHGLVHLLYMGHSLGYFELEKGFIWPENSIFLKKIFTPQRKKMIAGVLCIIAALAFAISGISVLSGGSWQKPVTIAAVAMSSLLFVVFWDGRLTKIHTRGGIAILINVMIFVYTIL